MPRLRLNLPATLPFSTNIRLRVTDINYGGHLGNDALLGLLHEARYRFLQHHGFTELNAGGAGLIMVDMVISYRKEAFLGETLRIEVGVGDVGRSGCDFIYRVTSAGALVAEAKTGMAFFDYTRRKLARVPPVFLTAVSGGG